MGFAVVNIFGLESFAGLWPVLLVYGAALAVAARLSACKVRHALMATVGLAGLATGAVVSTFYAPTKPPAPHSEAAGSIGRWKVAVTRAAERVDRRREVLADYIDENLPHIPQMLHAHCRELQDALATRGLLCIDVDPDTPRPTVSVHSDPKAVALWNAYRSAKNDLDRLVSAHREPKL